MRRSLAVTALLLAVSACTARTLTTRIPRTLDPRPPLAGADAELGLAYASSAPAQTLDLYRSKKGAAPMPVVLRFGGGHEGPVAAAIIEAGYALAVVRHRPPSEAPLVAAGQDAKAAVRFLRANAERLGLDASRFIAWGEADEGWLVVMLGVTGDQPTVFDDPALGHAGTSSAVRVVIDWGAPTAFGELDHDHAEHGSPACNQTYERHALPGTRLSAWVCGSPQVALGDPACATAVRATTLETYVASAKSFPAFYFAHGADDCVVSIWQTVRVHRALQLREEGPTLHRMSRAGRNDARFEFEETARSLDFIRNTFHPDASAP